MKGVYPYKYMSSWKRFKETSLPDKKELYDHLNVKYITDANFKHAKTFWRDFALKF